MELKNIVMAASCLAKDLQQFHTESNANDRPEGPSLSDKALTAYLADCLDLLRQLENKLYRIV